MNPKRKQRLLLILLGVCGVSIAVFLAIFALRQNLNYFFTPTEISQGLAPKAQVIRAGGMIRAGSVEREEGSLKVFFEVTDFSADVSIVYDGILPDLFKEGEGVVVIGQLGEANLFTADTVLAKHDETYMPPEVTHALEQAGQASTTY